MELIKLNENSKTTTQPEGFMNIKLFPHQLTLLKHCMDLEKNKYIKGKITEKNYYYFYRYPIPQYENIQYHMNTDFGVLCDKVGSGKSFVILALIMKNKFLENSNTYPGVSHESNSFNITIKNENYLSINILFVPHTIYHQWKDYISKFTNLNYYGIKTKKDLIDDVNFYEKFDLILVTSSKHYKVQQLFSSHILSRVFYDEVDSIKISKCDKINASFHWYVTSSYNNLYEPSGVWKIKTDSVQDEWGRYVYMRTNGIMCSKYIKDLFISLRSVSFKGKKNLFLCNEDKYIDSSLDLIPYKIFKIICNNPYAAKILNGIIGNELINMINANDIDSVVESLSCESTSEDNLINILCDKYIKNINNLRIELNAINLMTYDNDEIKNKKIKDIEQKIEEFKTKIKLIHARIKEGNNCPICFEEPEHKTIVNCCNNPFCLNCIIKYLDYKKQNRGQIVCPLCRSTKIDPNNFLISHESNKINDIDDTDKPKTKIDELEIIINNNKGKKILIFSEYDNSFGKIEKVLKNNEIGYEKIKGGGIKNIISRFKKKKSVDILLLNSRFCGSGINLENADIVIIYHKMSNDLENQVIGRAQRIGRTCQLEVYKLLHENEIEI